jgi:hypothetical protein
MLANKMINRPLSAGVFSIFLLLSCGQAPSDNGEADEEPAQAAVSFRVIEKPAEKKVEILADGELFTAYIYPDNIAKPVLYPLLTASGKRLTRGYPLEPVAGERVDHPHHVGHWLNYGDVNGLDFWNNSEAIPEERKDRYGSIRHSEVVNTAGGKGEAQLEVKTEWVTPGGDVLLDESTKFVFTQSGNTRIIDRTTTLTARDQKVEFKDNKEGMIAIRVTRALELPADKPEIFTDAAGNPTEVKTLDNTGVMGNYLSSEGLEGNDVWGTRAKWVKLYSQIEGEPVSITIMDHPGNVGYPTYWHARGYGLFAANPLGQKVFSEGKEELNFVLEPGASVTFQYRIALHSGDELGKDSIETLYGDFVE